MEQNEETMKMAPRVDVAAFTQRIDMIKRRIADVIVGQELVVDLLLTAVLADGHVLLDAGRFFFFVFLIAKRRDLQKLTGEVFS